MVATKYQATVTPATAVLAGAPATRILPFSGGPQAVTFRRLAVCVEDSGEGSKGLLTVPVSLEQGPFARMDEARLWVRHGDRAFGG